MRHFRAIWITVISVGMFLLVSHHIAVRTVPEYAALFPEHSAPDRWDAFKPVLVETLREGIANSFAAYAVSDEALDRIVECEADEHVKWLNSTPCSAEFDASLKTHAEHLDNQSGCLHDAGSRAIYDIIDLKCMLAHVPNDWNVVQPVNATVFENGYLEEGMSSAAARELAACVTKRVAVALNDSSCKPLNADAERTEHLFEAKCSEADWVVKLYEDAESVCTDEIDN